MYNSCAPEWDSVVLVVNPNLPRCPPHISWGSNILLGVSWFPEVRQHPLYSFTFDVWTSQPRVSRRSGWWNELVWSFDSDWFSIIVLYSDTNPQRQETSGGDLFPHHVPIPPGYFRGTPSGQDERKVKGRSVGTLTLGEDQG